MAVKMTLVYVWSIMIAVFMYAVPVHGEIREKRQSNIEDEKEIIEILDMLEQYELLKSMEMYSNMDEINNMNQKNIETGEEAGDKEVAE